MKSQTTQPVQLEFNFDELPKEEPKPALPHYDAPKCDNERLLNYQYEYKEHGSETALNSMYALGYEIALKYIAKKAKGNRNIARVSAYEKEEKAHNAITYIIARYLKVKDFRITESFTSYLYLRVQHELFYRRKVDEIVRFVDIEELYRGKQ